MTLRLSLPLGPPSGGLRMIGRSDIVQVSL